MNEQPSHISQRIRTMQIIAGTLMMGAVLFAALSIFLSKALDQAPGDTAQSVGGIVFCVVALVLQLVVPRIIESRIDHGDSAQYDEEQWCGFFQTILIVRLAILEGAAFYNLAAMRAEHHWWSLLIVGVLLFWMLVQFPTETRVRQWIESRQTTE